MQLDVFTILVFLGTFCFLAGICLLSIWLQTRSETGVLLWSISCFVRSAALPLLLLGEAHSVRLPVDLFGSILFVALGFSWMGTRSFAGRPIRGWVAALPVLIWLGLCQVPEISGNIGMHLFFHSALLTVCTTVIAVEFWRGSTASDKLRRGMALIFVFVSAFHCFRGFVAMFTVFPGDIMSGNNALAISVFAPLLVVLVGAMLWLSIYWRGYVAELKNHAERDPLTNVFNRRSLVGRAEALIKSRQRSGKATALLLFDLDHFKAVNDTHGHAGGDLVLKQFCDLMTAELSCSDLFARLGGEEFVAMLAANSPNDAFLTAEKLRKIVSAANFELSGGSISVTVSVGVAIADEQYRSFPSLMKKADSALYVSKRAGRNRVSNSRTPAMDKILDGEKELLMEDSIAA